MICSDIMNQICSSGVTMDEASSAISRAFRSMANVTPSDFDMNNPRFAGGKVNITGGMKGGQSGGKGGEFMGRLFPYLGDIDWGDRKQEYWCQRCGDYTRSGVVVAEGWRWIVCKECLYSTKLREDIDPF